MLSMSFQVPGWAARAGQNPCFPQRDDGQFAELIQQYHTKYVAMKEEGAIPTPTFCYSCIYFSSSDLKPESWRAVPTWRLATLAHLLCQPAAVAQRGGQANSKRTKYRLLRRIVQASPRQSPRIKSPVRMVFVYPLRNGPLFCPSR